MRRLRLVAGCAAVAAMLCGVFASGALAGKVAPITGPIKVTSTTGEAELKAPVATIKCKKGTDVGEITGPKTGTDTVTFDECEGYGDKCESAGESAGTIKTALLTTTLGWVDALKGEVGVDLSPASGTYLAEFNCEGIQTKVKGSVIGGLTPIDESGETSTETFTGSGFAQFPQNLEGLSKDTLITTTSKTGEAEYESLQKAIGTTTTDEVETIGKKGKIEFRKDPGEVSTESGTPEWGRCQAHKKGKYKDANCTEVDIVKGKYKGSYEFEAV